MRLAPLALLLAMLAATPASAQIAYDYADDYDPGWASRAMSGSGTRVRNAQRYRYYVYRPRYYHQHRPRAYYAPRPSPYYIYRPRHHYAGHHHPGTRVYSYVQRDRYGVHAEPAPRAADTSRCKIPFAAPGDQHVTESGAKGEAEKAWSQATRFAHGELWADVAHAKDKSFLCVKSSISPGLFHRCELRATPCAPARQGVDSAGQE